MARTEHDDGEWAWMMDWCKENRLPPGNGPAWRQAKRAYNKVVKEMFEGIQQAAVEYIIKKRLFPS